MASLSGNNDAGNSGQGISSELRARDLPSKRLLGKGLASIAYETEWNGERFARKDFIGVPSGTFQKEADVLVGLKDHKNVVKTYGRTVDEVSCSLVVEYMEDDLLDLLQKKKESLGRPAGTTSGNQSERSHSYPFELPEVLGIILQISRGMKFLHDQNILHGDLKTKNIVVTHMNDGDKNLLSVKVADFGLVRTKSKSMSFVSRQARKLDVIQWKAPEILERLLLEDNDETSSESDSNSDEECTVSPGVTGKLAFAADVYSFAVTCSQILTGKDPYPNRNWKELGAQIISGELRPDLPATCPTSLEELLSRCWKRDSAQRPTFSDICMTLERLHNPQMLTKHPEKSRGIREWLQSRHNERHATDFTQLPKYQLEVRMCCNKCAEKVIDEIRGVPGVFDVRAEVNKVVVVSSTPSDLDKHQVLCMAQKIDSKAEFVKPKKGDDDKEEKGEAGSMRASKPSYRGGQYYPPNSYNPEGIRPMQNYASYNHYPSSPGEYWSRQNDASYYYYPPLPGEDRPRQNYYPPTPYNPYTPGEDRPRQNYYPPTPYNPYTPGEDRYCREPSPRGEYLSSFNRARNYATDQYYRSLRREPRPRQNDVSDGYY